PLVEKADNPAWPRFLALAVDGAGRLALGSITGEVYQLNAGGGLRGELESAVRDAGSLARWGRITWIARAPEGSRVTLQTRSGNSEQPDETWSPWSPLYPAPGASVASPPARYLQYRAVLIREKEGVSPLLSEVAIVYLPRNSEPTVTLTTPKGGEAWSKKQTIRWTGSDPDKDVLLYDLFYSADDGKSWVKLNRVVKPKESGGNGTPGKALESPGPARNTQSPAAAPPPSTPAAPTSNPPATEGTPRTAASTPRVETAAAGVAAAPESAASSTPSAPPKSPVPADPVRNESLKETSYTWDTTEVPDGTYWIKLVASDRLSNPVDARSVERVAGPILISNTPPQLSLRSGPTVDPDGAVRLAGRAQARVPMAGVDYRVDEGEWTAAAADDGIFDAESEGFSLRTPPLQKGEHTLEVRAVDAAGNHATEKRKVTLP
ncbi:MAG: hypothetical protein QHJ73_14755, partial [Armatimonadota bacterium]|nr:hypothetical protein [Armatimonadota bacterium]